MLGFEQPVMVKESFWGQLKIFLKIGTQSNLSNSFSYRFRVIRNRRRKISEKSEKLSIFNCRKYSQY